MDESSPPKEYDPRIGLCSSCRHANVIAHPRGGIDYYMCGRADDEAEFRKYPRLPVIACPGYEDSNA